MALAGGASLFSALLGSNAASNAASTQAAAADRAAALQKQMFDEQVRLQAPFRAGGLAAQNRLLELMGLRYAGGQSGQGGGMPTVRSDAELRAALQGQYTSSSQQVRRGAGGPEGDVTMYTVPGSVDEAGLAAAISAARQREQAAADSYQTGSSSGGSPDFGKYARDFSMADFQQDPGYAWRLQQGQQAIERSAAARGGLGGGRMAKDLTNYAQGAASQEYGNAYNRYQTNRANQLNPLQSLAGVAQTATGQMQSAAQSYGNNASNNAMAAGNANASGYMGAANAISGGVGQGLNYFQNQNMMNRLFPQAGSGYVPPIQDNGYSLGTGSAYNTQRAGM
jgi:hypothetical protein